MLQREGISDCNLRNTKLRAIAEQVDTIQEDATSALVSIEDVETLVLEVYNSMQSDGEHIFLPQSIASQLHAVAQMLKYIKDGNQANNEMHEITAISNQMMELHLDDRHSRVLSDSDYDNTASALRTDNELPTLSPIQGTTASPSNVVRQGFGFLTSKQSRLLRVKTTDTSSRWRNDQDLTSTNSYEKRKNAVQTQRLRDTRDIIKKQREEVRRRLKQVQQKELEAKKERVTRMKKEKEQRKLIMTRLSVKK